MNALFGNSPIIELAQHIKVLQSQIGSQSQKDQSFQRISQIINNGEVDAGSAQMARNILQGLGYDISSATPKTDMPFVPAGNTRYQGISEVTYQPQEIPLETQRINTANKLNELVSLINSAENQSDTANNNPTLPEENKNLFYANEGRLRAEYRKYKKYLEKLDIEITNQKAKSIAPPVAPVPVAPVQPETIETPVKQNIENQKTPENPKQNYQQNQSKK